MQTVAARRHDDTPILGLSVAFDNRSVCSPPLLRLYKRLGTHVLAHDLDTRLAARWFDVLQLLAISYDSAPYSDYDIPRSVPVKCLFQRISARFQHYTRYDHSRQRHRDDTEIGLPARDLNSSRQHLRILR